MLAMRRSFVLLVIALVALPGCQRRQSLFSPDNVSRLQICWSTHATVREVFGEPDDVGQVGTTALWSYWKYRGDRKKKPPTLMVAISMSTGQVVDLAYNSPALVTLSDHCR